MGNRWTKKDRNEADQEFWGIEKFKRGYVLYAFLNSYMTTAEVRKKIMQRAKEGSRLHRKALALLTLQR